MDERDNKALNKGPMSNTEETNKLSAEEYYVENCFWQRIDKAFVIELMESYAQLRVEQEKESIRQFLISEGFEMLAEKI